MITLLEQLIYINEDENYVVPEGYVATKSEVEEVVDVIGGMGALWNTTQKLVEEYVLLIDPNGDYPNLQQELLEQVVSDPEYLDKITDLHTPTEMPDGSIAPVGESGTPSGDSFDWFLDKLRQGASQAIGLSDTYIEQLIDSARQGLEDTATTYRNFYNEEMRAAMEKALSQPGGGQFLDGLFDAISNIGTVVDYGLMYLDFMSALTDAMESGWDPKVTFAKLMAAAGGAALGAIATGGLLPAVIAAVVAVTMFDKGAEEAAKLIEFLGKVFTRAAMNVHEDFKEFAKAAGQEIGKIFVAAKEDYDEAKKFLEKLWDTGVEMAGAGLEALGEGLEALGEGLQGIWEGVRGAIEAAGNALGNFIGEHFPELGQWFVDFWEATGDAAWMGSPLVLDLDGDGIELVSLTDSTLFWDIDEDGFAEHTGWVAADDGMLAIDLNGDGVVTDHAELFGSIDQDGFTALSVYDTNGDGVIDANDAQFNDLIIWQDVNQNGMSEEGEISTLADFNIVSIDLNASTPYQMYIEGHHISHVSSYTVDDGVSGSQTYEIVDAWFDYDNRNTEFIGDYTLDIETLFLATMRGYGSLPDLHVSASMDNDTTDPNSLKSLLVAFDALELTDLFASDGIIMEKMHEIMLRWAGADTVDPTSSGQWANAQELAFMNALRGEQWLLFGGSPDPWANSWEGLQKAFAIAQYAIAARLIAQSAGAELFNEETYYNHVTDSFEGFTAFNQEALDTILAKSLDGTQVQDKTEYWVQVVNMIDNSVGIENLTTDQYNALEATVQASDDTLTIALVQDKITKNIEDFMGLDNTPAGDYLGGTADADIYTGTVGDDFFNGGSGDDILSGGIGDDKFYGSAGNDILDGQLGDDYLWGGHGDDTYKFFLGHDDDLIVESSGNDRILFGDGITANDLSFIRVGAYDLMVKLDPNVGYGSLTIQGQFAGGAMETLEFADGSTIDLDSVDYTYIGTDDSETIYGVRGGVGGSGVDTLYGLGGDDVIYAYGPSGASATQNQIFGGDGNDTLFGEHYGDFLDGGDGNDTINAGIGIDTIIGGLGDDTLKGNKGDDIYIFNYGDGNDIFYDTGGIDVVRFGAGITFEMLNIYRVDNNDVMIEVDGGTGGSILLDWQTYGYIVETLEFDDGSTVAMNTIEMTLNGTENGETLYGVKVGGSQVDTIYGHGGNDVIYGYRNPADYSDNFLYGGDGNDTIYSAHGIDYVEGNDGDDLVFGYNGNDEIHGGAGNDNLRGGNHDDVLYGGAGDDILLGENNNDVLIGGLGIDTLTGGGGYDVFTFLADSSFDNIDTITDFNTTYDSIDISDILSAYDPLSDAITDFVQITDDGSDSTLLVDIDGGADNFVAIALIDNKTGLTDIESLETNGSLVTV